MSFANALLPQSLLGGSQASTLPLPATVLNAKRPGFRPAFSGCARCGERSADGDVRGLKALRTFGHVELDLSAFLQAAEDLGIDGREVHEHVLATLGRDETEALRIVEPLDGSGLTQGVELLSRVLLPRRANWLLQIS